MIVSAAISVGILLAELFRWLHCYTGNRQGSNRRGNNRQGSNRRGKNKRGKNRRGKKARHRNPTMNIPGSGAGVESPSATSQQAFAQVSPVSLQSPPFSSPPVPPVGSASSSQSTPTVMSPTQSSSVSSSSLSISQSPTGDNLQNSASPSHVNHTSILSPSNSLIYAAKGTWPHDPLRSFDWDSAGPPGILCSHRVRKDLKSIFSDPLPGIFIVPEEENLFKVHCLIIGPFDTPYEGGFFHFIIRFGPQYPLHPPRVRLMTTGEGSVRFNPNLYKNGKVCLSILGTWSGPAWSPASNLSSVVLSLQSLMNEHPYHNEPGYEKERRPGDSENYNTIIRHETIRVAVIQQLVCVPAAPEELVRVMRASFMEYFDHYVEICKKNLHRDGTAMEDPFGEVRGNFQFGAMLKQLDKLKDGIEERGIPPLPEFSNGQVKEVLSENEDDGDASSISLSDTNEGVLASDEDDDDDDDDDNDNGDDNADSGGEVTEE